MKLYPDVICVEFEEESSACVHTHTSCADICLTNNTIPFELVWLAGLGLFR